MDYYGYDLGDIPNEQYNFDTEFCCPMTEQAAKSGWPMGSHYHCANCYHLSSMMGHMTSVHYVDGQSVNVDFHRHCREINYCELEDNEGNI